ncbi:hypothetical protein MHBO_001114 [Bonamia ostreae]|uniref:Sushi domain-containing protein n=1 Tax=Bonamia ostreae TaxID=126728 RepID=A0ABV2AHW0_9EUKA
MENFCPPLSNGDWGTVDVGDASLGTILKIDCKKNFSHVKESAECAIIEGKGQWANGAVQCYRKPNYEINSVLIFDCIEHFVPPSKETVCVFNEVKQKLEWNGETNCTAINEYCPSIPEGDWGSVDVGDRSIGTNLKYSCCEGYNKPFNQPVTCREDVNGGSWYPSNGTECQMIKGCKNFEKRALFGHSYANNAIVGDQVYIKCAYGFDLPDKIAVCVKMNDLFEYWSGENECIAIEMYNGGH